MGLLSLRGWMKGSGLLGGFAAPAPTQFRRGAGCRDARPGARQPPAVPAAARPWTRLLLAPASGRAPPRAPPAAQCPPSMASQGRCELGNMEVTRNAAAGVSLRPRVAPAAAPDRRPHASPKDVLRAGWTAGCARAPCCAGSTVPAQGRVWRHSLPLVRWTHFFPVTPEPERTLPAHHAVSPLTSAPCGPHPGPAWGRRGLSALGEHRRRRGGLQGVHTHVQRSQRAGCHAPGLPLLPLLTHRLGDKRRPCCVAQRGRDSQAGRTRPGSATRPGRGGSSVGSSGGRHWPQSRSPTARCVAVTRGGSERTRPVAAASDVRGTRGGMPAVRP